MEVIAVLSILGLVFAGIVFLQIRHVWLRYRLIAVMLPSAGDPQVFSYKLTEAVWGFGFREVPQSGPGRVFQGPAWQRWAVGLQDISVQPTGNEAMLLTGPGFWVSSIGRRFSGATRRPYDGRQPVWPLCKGMMRIMGVLIVLLGLSLLAFLLFGR